MVSLASTTRDRDVFDLVRPTINVISLFHSLSDTDKTGDISYEEFAQALSSSGYTKEQLKPVFEAVVSIAAVVLLN